jgi:hypothetical protein
MEGLGGSEHAKSHPTPIIIMAGELSLEDHPGPTSILSYHIIVTYTFKY